MLREQVWDIGKSLIARLQRDYGFMVQHTLGVVQNNHPWGNDDKKNAVQASIEHLNQAEKQLIEEFAQYRKALESFRDS